MESAKTSQPAGGVATQPQRKLSAKEILADLREGMSDRDLEQKYRLTSDGREKVFKTLIAKGLMAEAEFQWRSKLLKTQAASDNVPASQLDPPTSGVDKPNKPLPLTESPSTPDSKTASLASKFRNGSWLEDKKILILLLVLAAPLGLYGLWKTSLFQTVTKAILALVTAVFVILLPQIAIPLWVIVSVAALGYVLWVYLRGAKQQVKQVPMPPRTTQQTVSIPCQPSPVTADSGTNQPSSGEKESEIGAVPRLLSMTTILRSFGLDEIKIVAVGAVLGGICAAVVTTYWGTATTSAKLLGKLAKPQSTTSWKWIIVCAILGAILAFCISRFLKRRRSGGNPKQAVPAPQPPRSAGPVSAEEIEEAIKRMESARRDMFGIAGNVGILGIGAAGGGIAAVAVAAFFGATSIWGVTRAGKWLGLSVQGSTPWTWIIGCAIVGAVLAFSISRLVGLSAKIGERKIRTLEDLRNQIRIRQKEAEGSKVDKDKYRKLQESLTMLLSNGKITPEESDGLINGIKGGTITYEFAFESVEEYLKE